MKIFNVSLYRSGTQSFSKFLTEHGLHGIHWFGLDFDDACRTSLCDLDTTRIWNKVLPAVRRFDHFSDLPFSFLLQEAAETYPDATFLTIVRDPFDWVRSVRRHVRHRELTTFEKIQFWLLNSERRFKIWEYSDDELADIYRTHARRCVETSARMGIKFRSFDLGRQELSLELEEFIGLTKKIDFPRQDYLGPLNRKQATIRQPQHKADGAGDDSRTSNSERLEVPSGLLVAWRRLALPDRAGGRGSRLQSRVLDAGLPQFLSHAAAIPLVNCFHETSSDTADRRSLKAAVASMRSAGHPVRVWSYAPEKLEFLRALGVELASAADIVPPELFARITGSTDIRFFSHVFRYALLYEQGGLWMDTDVIMLRSFPYRGDYFLNLRWSGNEQDGNFLCGNVIYAKPHSPHMRHLYETALGRFLHGDATDCVDVGSGLLSSYVMSEAAAELRDWIFSPIPFNSVGKSDLGVLEQPIGELGEYLNDERVFGIHLWSTPADAGSKSGGGSLISFLSEPLLHFPPLEDLADSFQTDRNRHHRNRHSFARAYGRLLAPRRLSTRRIMEIGLWDWNETRIQAVALWQRYFPFCEVIGIARGDFSRFDDARFTSFACDPSNAGDLRAVAEAVGPRSLDMIVDDGSHASIDQQMGIREFFPLLAGGGWYFIQSLDWQPADEDRDFIPSTKQLFLEIKGGRPPAIDPFGVGRFADEFEQVLFFDSHYQLGRANLLGGLVAIRKRGGCGFD